MILRVQHNKVYLESITDEGLACVRKALKIHFKDQYTPLGFQTINLYDWKEKSFPTGYLGRIQRALEKARIDFTQSDQRRYPGPKIKFKGSLGFDFFDHQDQAVEAALLAHTGLISCPTATGKSAIISETIRGRGVRTLVIVPFEGIQIQLAKTLSKALGQKYVGTDGEKIKDQKPSWMKSDEDLSSGEVMGAGYNAIDETEEKRSPMGSGYNDGDEVQLKSRPLGSSYSEALGYEGAEIPKSTGFGKKRTALKTYKPLQSKTQLGQYKDKEVTVICYQSLGLLTDEFLESIECVIVDEAHHGAAETIRAGLLRLKNAAYRYGFSGTAWRDKEHERKLLESALGATIIYEFTAEDAIEKEIISKPELYRINASQPDVFLGRTKRWRRAKEDPPSALAVLDDGIIHNRARNQDTVDLAKKLFDEGENIFIALDEVQHLNNLMVLFRQAGLQPNAIHGQQSSRINQKHVKLAGETTGPLITIATMAAGEGTDMPNITVVLLASAGKGSIPWLQRIGRGLRRGSNNKSVLKVFHFFDWFSPILRRHSQIRELVFRKYYKVAEIKNYKPDQSL